jgi:hypothetical protein
MPFKVLKRIGLRVWGASSVRHNVPVDAAMFNRKSPFSGGTMSDRRADHGVTGIRATARAGGTGASAARDDTPAAQRCGTRAQGQGVEIIGDLDDEDSLKRAVEGACLRGAEHVGGRRREGRDAGHRLARLRTLRASSATSTRRWDPPTATPDSPLTTSTASKTPKPGFPSAIIRPVFFWENLTARS